MLTKRIGIDLGTANVLVYVKGEGIVIKEPAVVALAVRDNTVVAVGSAARDMIGRTPSGIQVIRPMKHGVIADYLITEAMLRHFISRVVGRVNLIRPEIMICIPAGVTSVEQRAVRDAAEQAGARRPAHLIPEPLAAAIGAHVPVGTASGNMVMDVGGGRSEAAVISMYGIVVKESVRVAGDAMDEAIVTYVKRRYNLAIGDRTAEDIKMSIGSAIPVTNELAMEVRGRDQITGLPKSITLTTNEVTQALQDSLSSICMAARTVLERTPPEMASDVVDRGIVLTGGGALLRGLDVLISEQTNVPCQVAENPLDCVAIGAGAALEYLDVIKRSLPTEEELLVSNQP
jgi:rod shape-determining protein MreB and related proteins